MTKMVEVRSGVHGLEVPVAPEALMLPAMAALLFYVTCLLEDLALELGLELVLPLCMIMLGSCIDRMVLIF